MTSKENTQLSPYEQWLAERAKILEGMTDQERSVIELEIRLFITEVFKKAKETPGGAFFKYDPFLENPLIKKYFKIMVTSGDRNIGKSFSLGEQRDKVNRNGGKWILMRNIQDEIIQHVKSELREGEYLEKRKLDVTNFKTADAYLLDEDKEELEIVGHYRDVNTIGKFKSINFPGVKLIAWEEFVSRVKVSDKAAKFVEFVSTVQRYNPDLQIICQSNYVDQSDPFLQLLQVGMEGIDTDVEFVKFSWISGSIQIFIPKGIYKSVGNAETNLGYRLSLENIDI